jgi:hypothetical protein
MILFQTKVKPLLVALLCIFLVSGCSKNNVTFYSGEVNAGFLDFLDTLDDGSSFSLASYGGDEQYALEAAEIIEQKGLSIEVVGICISACFDFLMPAAKQIEFINKPIVGSHGNTVLAYRLTVATGLLSSTPDLGKTCVRRANWLLDIWKRNGVDSEVFLEKIMRLRPYQVVVENSYCARFKLAVDYWLPSSAEMKAFFGERVKGKLCSDDLRCLETKLSKMPHVKSIISDNKIIELNR